MSAALVEQLAIGLFGVAAIWLSQDPRSSRRRWSPVLGLVAQPFWFYTTWRAGQYGIFALSFFYTFSWARGFVAHWVRRVA